MTIQEPATGTRLRKTIRVVQILALFYLFFVGIKLMGNGFEALAAGEDSFARRLIREADNPFIGLSVGILVTSIIQSSGVTTSIIVGLVSATVLDSHGRSVPLLTVHAAVPIVMGANIGTTVTNLLVSMGYITRKEEFRRAISGAVVHDLFNVFTVAILLPIELATGYLERTATWLTAPFQSAAGGGPRSFDLLEPLLAPAIRVFEWVAGKPHGPGWAAGLAAIAGMVLIILSLVLLLKVLQSVMMAQAESLVSKVLGKSGYLGVLIGIIVTVSVRSSSIVTSLLVPLAASGIVTVSQIFPLAVGANIGTTFTALIASLAGNVAGLTIALVHLLFNISGALLFFPVPAMRRIPVRLAERIGVFAAERRKLFVVLGLVLFYGIPGLLILLFRVL